MPSATSHTRTKSSTKVSSQRRLWPGKCSQVLWWMWTLELWLPQPVRNNNTDWNIRDMQTKVFRLISLWNPYLSTVQGWVENHMVMADFHHIFSQCGDHCSLSTLAFGRCVQAWGPVSTHCSKYSRRDGLTGFDGNVSEFRGSQNQTWHPTAHKLASELKANTPLHSIAKIVFPIFGKKSQPLESLPAKLWRYHCTHMHTHAHSNT